VKIRPDTSLLARLTRFIHLSQDSRPTFQMAAVSRLESTDFFVQLAQRLGGRDDALLFIHGYNVTFANACARTAQLAYDLGFGGAPIMWSWPSSGEIADYFKDETDNEWSTGHLREFLVRVARQSGARRVHVIAHSMGTRLLMNTALRILSDPDLRPQVRFSNLILAAPDIDRDLFVELMPVARRIAETTTLYASSADRALEASRAVHRYPRAGAVAPPITLSGVDSIDASGIDTSLIGLGHAYYVESAPVVADIRKVLLGEAPQRRAPDIPLRRSTGDGGLPYWTIGGTP
jgi:esterase/lipase superfamily enzyme